jgi:hypothetical protein
MDINYVAAFVILAVFAGLYYANGAKRMRDWGRDGEGGYSFLRQYLATGTDGLDGSRKPIMWIHVPYELNSRSAMLAAGGPGLMAHGQQGLDMHRYRPAPVSNSHELNQPYLYITLRTLIQQNDEGFKIVIIDDRSFPRLLDFGRGSGYGPQAKYESTQTARTTSQRGVKESDFGRNAEHGDGLPPMDTLAEPTKSYVRRLCMARLLHRYGGVQVPISFLCFKPLIRLFRSGTGGASGSDDGSGAFVAESVCRDVSLNESGRGWCPNPDFMGVGAPRSEVMRRYVEFLEQVVSRDPSAQSQFSGAFARWCERESQRGHLRVIAADQVGTRTADGRPVLIDTLLSTEFLDVWDGAYGIWIPSEQLLQRHHYDWFVLSGVDDILGSAYTLAKHMVNALGEASLASMRRQESMETRRDQDDGGRGWISFWRVPMSSTLNIFGVKPMGLGDHVPRAHDAGNLP